MSLFLPMETESLFMASKQVLGREWGLTYAFQECQSETKQHCHCEAPGLHQPRDHVPVADFPLPDGNGVGIATVVSVCGRILY